MINLLTKGIIKNNNKHAKSTSIALSLVRLYSKLEPKVLFCRPDPNEIPTVTNTDGMGKFIVM
jgi:hypothetical protein